MKWERKKKKRREEQGERIEQEYHYYFAFSSTSNSMILLSFDCIHSLNNTSLSISFLLIPFFIKSSAPSRTSRVWNMIERFPFLFLFKSAHFILRFVKGENRKSSCGRQKMKRILKCTQLPTSHFHSVSNSSERQEKG